MKVHAHRLVPMHAVARITQWVTQAQITAEHKLMSSKHWGEILAGLLLVPFLFIVGVRDAHGYTAWEWRVVGIWRQPDWVVTGPNTTFTSKAAALQALRGLNYSTNFVGSDLTVEDGVTGANYGWVRYRYSMTPRKQPTIGPWQYENQGHWFDNEAAAVAERVSWFSFCNPGWTMGGPAEDWRHRTVFISVPPEPNMREERAYEVTDWGNCSTPEPPPWYEFFQRYRSVTCPVGYRLDQSDLVNLTCIANGYVGYIEGRPVECDASGPPSSVGNPCDVATGEKFAEEVDYKGRGIEFRRYYHSALIEGRSGVGAGWSHNYSARLILDSSGVPVQLIRPNGYQEAIARYKNAYRSYSSGIRVARVGSEYWVYLDSGAVEVYDLQGRLTKIFAGANGQSATTLSYDSDGHLATVTGPWGHTLTFSFAQGKLVGVRDPANQNFLYHYDAAGNLSSIEYPDGGSRVYHYENSTYPNHLTGITDESGVRFATYSYDASGRAESSQHADGVGRVVLAYGANNTTVTDALGATTTYTFTTDGTRSRRITGMTKEGESTAYVVPDASIDEQRRVTQVTDARGQVTKYEYDGDHLRSVTEAYGTDVARTVSYSYNYDSSSAFDYALASLPSDIDEPGRSTSYIRDAHGNVLEKTVYDTTTDEWRTWHYTYNGFGRLLTEDGPRNNMADARDVTEYTYYNCATGAQCGQIETAKNAVGQVTTFSTYNDHGQPLTIGNPNGVVTTFTYDLRQRVTSRADGTEVTLFEYWPTGLLKKETRPDGSYLQYTYDNAQRLTDIIDAEGNRIHYDLDKMGNRVGETAYDSSSAPTRTHSRQFDKLNRLHQDIGAAGTGNVTTTFGYDNNGNLTSLSAPLGRDTAQSYDELNRPVSVTDPLGGLTKYVHNALDQLISVTDPQGLTTSYEYNALGDLTQQTSPDTGVTSNTYDAAGNLQSRTDARGTSVGRGIYTYDALNRPTQIVYPDHTVTYQYDTCTNGVGRLCTMTDSGGTTEYEYDVHGRVTMKAQTVSLGQGKPDQRREVQYTYTSGLLTRRRVLPDGVDVYYEHNAAGRISAIRAQVPGRSLQTILSDVLYDFDGNVRGWTWGNGSLAVREYDQDGRPLIFDSAGQSAYTYDDAGRVTAIATEGVIYNNAPSYTYDYDELDRVTSASRYDLSHTYFDLTKTYAYDGNGNRTQLGGTESAVYNYANPFASNRLASVSGSQSRTYQYDVAGNMTSDGLTNFTYDGAGRMVAASIGATTYGYNGRGQRMVKYSAGSLEASYLYDEEGHLIDKCPVFDPNGNECEQFRHQEIIWLGDIPVSAILYFITFDPEGYVYDALSETFFLHTDHLNTPRWMTRFESGNGATYMWSWRSDPFGDGSAAVIYPNYQTAFAFDLRLPGQVFDAETGLNYNYFRDYDPRSGRYVQSDPVGLKAGVNTYAYVRGNPLRDVDSRGLMSSIDAKLWSNYYFGHEAYVDISSACGIYVGDPVIAQQINSIRGEAELRGRELLPTVGQNQTLSFSLSYRAHLVVGSIFNNDIYSFGEGDHEQAASCTLSKGCGMCATLTCGLGVAARDRFHDPYDLHTDLGGTPFWFGLKCNAGSFSKQVCGQ